MKAKQQRHDFRILLLSATKASLSLCFLATVPPPDTAVQDEEGRMYSQNMRHHYTETQLCAHLF